MKKFPERYLQSIIMEDALASCKMAFLSGPRQVGKTTLAKAILNLERQELNYYTWDDSEFRKIWKQRTKDIFNLPQFPACLVFDEIHKDTKWKNTLKGIYDIYGERTKIIVTGSARLDYFRRSGDSLQGRYIPYRLHPLSVGESPGIKPPPKIEWLEHSKKVFNTEELLQLGGFPEPFFAQSDQKAQRWRRLYRERLIREDLRDLKAVRDLQQLENLAIFLPDRVGSPLSYQSLQEDLSCAFDTLSTWLTALEALYFCYRIKPYSRRIKNSIKKAPKLYMFDWAGISDSGARLENFVASHLLKACHAWSDSAQGDFQLYYIRDKQKREVDFFITCDDKPYLMLEVKSGETKPSAALEYYSELLKPKFTIQLVMSQRVERKPSLSSPRIEFMEIGRFLGALP